MQRQTKKSTILECCKRQNFFNDEKLNLILSCILLRTLYSKGRHDNRLYFVFHVSQARKTRDMFTLNAFAWKKRMGGHRAGRGHQSYNLLIVSVGLLYMDGTWLCPATRTRTLTYLPTYLFTYLPTYLHTYLPTYLPTTDFQYLSRSEIGQQLFLKSSV